MEIFRQILTVEIKKPKSKPFLVTTWYRPPDSKVEIFDKFESYLLKLDQEDKESIIMGDIGVRAGGARGAAAPHQSLGNSDFLGSRENLGKASI